MIEDQGASRDLGSGASGSMGLRHLERALRSEDFPLDGLRYVENWPGSSEAIERQNPGVLRAGYHVVAFYRSMFQWRMAGRDYAVILDPIIRQDGQTYFEDREAMMLALAEHIRATNQSSAERTAARLPG